MYTAYSHCTPSHNHTQVIGSGGNEIEYFECMESILLVDDLFLMELKLSSKFLSRNAFNIVLRILVALRHHLAWDFLFSLSTLLPLPSSYMLFATRVPHAKLILQSTKQYYPFEKSSFP